MVNFKLPWYQKLNLKTIHHPSLDGLNKFKVSVLQNETSETGKKYFVIIWPLSTFLNHPSALLSNKASFLLKQRAFFQFKNNFEIKNNFLIFHIFCLRDFYQIFRTSILWRMMYNNKIYVVRYERCSWKKEI